MTAEAETDKKSLTRKNTEMTPVFEYSGRVQPVPTLKEPPPVTKPEIELNFDETKVAFGNRSTFELVRAWGVFRLCGIPTLVRNANYLNKMALQYLGPRLTNKIMELTFFGHFCGGTDGNTIQPTIKRLKQSGVGSILDYAAEADVPEAQKRDIDPTIRSLITARTYDYANEAMCDANADICMKAIETAATMQDGFAAIKITALGKPEFLIHISDIIQQTRDIFAGFDGPNAARHHKTKGGSSVGMTEGAALDQAARRAARLAAHPLPHSSASLARRVDRAAFVQGLKAGGVELSEAECSALFKSIDSSGDGVIDVIEWLEAMNPVDLTIGPLGRFRSVAGLNEDEVTQLRNMFGRLDRLAECARRTGVRLLVDAEQTYFQTAIDHIVLQLQRKHNRERAVVYNTQQCYLLEAGQDIETELERAKREGWVYGLKLVRGAYMVQERTRALEMGYQSPIHKSKEDTHRSYDTNLDRVLEAVAAKRAEVLVASHNERSTLRAARLMSRHGIPNSGGGVFFGQLLGMCDHVTLALGAHGYQVYKYVPYGPVHEVMPYLIRRAEENSTMLSGDKRDMLLLTTEIKRRFGLGGSSGGSGSSTKVVEEEKKKAGGA